MDISTISRPWTSKSLQFPIKTPLLRVIVGFTTITRSKAHQEIQAGTFMVTTQPRLPICTVCPVKPDCTRKGHSEKDNCTRPTAHSRKTKLTKRTPCFHSESSSKYCQPPPTILTLRNLSSDIDVPSHRSCFHAYSPLPPMEPQGSEAPRPDLNDCCPPFNVELGLAMSIYNIEGAGKHNHP